MSNNVSYFVPRDKAKSSKFGSDGGDMDGRIGRLELDVEYIKRDISDIKGTLKDHSNDFANIKKEISYFQTETGKEFGSLRSDMNREFGNVRSDMNREFGNLRTEMHSLARQIIMWNIATVFTTVGLVFALMRYFN